MNIYIQSKIKIELDRIEQDIPTSIKMDHIIYFIHLINYLQERRGGSLKKQDYTPISAKLMGHYSIRNFKEIYKYLGDQLGIIEHTGYTDGKSRKFKIAHKWQSKIVILKSDNSRFWKNTEKKIIDRSRSGNLKVGEFFNDRLTIEYKAAKRSIKNRYKADKKNAKSEKEKVKAKNRRNQGLQSIAAISDKEFYYHKDDQGRIHTNLTNLRSELRQFLRYDGEKLVNIDFVNSQPMLSSLLFEEGFWIGPHPLFHKELEALGFNNYRKWKPSIEGFTINSNENKKENVSLIPQNEIHILPLLLPFNYTYISSTLMFCKTPVGLTGFDVDRYNFATREGWFYEDLSDIRPLKGEQRKKVKAEVFEVFFGTPVSKKRPRKIKKAFTVLYPEVAKLFDLIKTETSGMGKESLALILQSLEARLVFVYLVPFLLKEISGIALFTIHDSIMVPESYKDSAYELILKRSTEILGFEPKLSVEDHN